jgi:hypothetical protein
LGRGWREVLKRVEGGRKEEGGRRELREKKGGGRPPNGSSPPNSRGWIYVIKKLTYRNIWGIIYKSPLPPPAFAFNNLSWKAIILVFIKPRTTLSSFRGLPPYEKRKGTSFLKSK